MSNFRPEHLNELSRSLEALRELLPQLTEDFRWGDGRATARHIAFHTSESADFWLRKVILGEDRTRDRDAEFTKSRDADAMAASIESAMAACRAVVGRAPGMAAVVEPPTMTEGRLHMTAHTAGHVGELTVAAALRP